MKWTETEIPYCFTIEVDLIQDERGYFNVPYNVEQFSKIYPPLPKFVQDNESYSKYGTIRGLHFQTGENKQAKLVRCSYGKVLDVVVDLRYLSPTHGKTLSFLLDKPNKMIFVPQGCAHGFSVLSDFAIFNYKVDNRYDKLSEGGIFYNDPTLNIDWMVPPSDQIVSDRDLTLPLFS